MPINKFVFCLIIISTVINANLSFAGGFVIYNHGAAATGVGGAFTAQADDPSAVLYNPAAINQLYGTNVSCGNTIVLPTGSFQNLQSGKKTHMREHIYSIPNFYITHRINDTVSLGLGAFSYLGLATDWPDDWEGKFISTYAHLKTYFVNPVISFQVVPELSIAFGIAPFYSDLRTKKALGISPSPFTLGSADLKADGIDITYNFALLYKISKRINFGFSYRSGAKIKYDGNIHFKASPVLAKLLPEGGVSLDMNLPALITTGVSFDITRYLTLEFDIYWQGWSTYNVLSPKYDNTVPRLLKKAFAPVIRDYSDITDYCFGVNYQASPNLSLRCGYFYDNSPVPDKTVDPILPDADKNTVAFGFGYKIEKCTFDFTYYAVFYKNRTIRNNIDGLNGTYKAFSQLFCTNVTFGF